MDTKGYHIPGHLDHPAGCGLEVRAADDGYALWLCNYAGDYARSANLPDWPAVLAELDTVLHWLRDCGQCPYVGITLAVPDHPECWRTEVIRVKARYYPERTRPWEGRRPGDALH